MSWEHPPVHLLASVKSEAEARLAARSGASIIDAKDPASGALGALPLGVIRGIRRAVPVHIQVSATIGDLPCEPETVARAAFDVAATGVDFIKAGFFPGGDTRATIARLAKLRIKPARLVGLLLADRDPDLTLISNMADAGFAGVMLDTAGKQTGALTDIVSREFLADFIARARHAKLFAGLAGALRVRHIPRLLTLGPDVLGFRGALCHEEDRSGQIDPDAFAAVRRAIPCRSRLMARNATDEMPAGDCPI